MAGVSQKSIVAKILIYPETRHAFLREIAIEGQTKKCEIDVSSGLHPCFKCHVVSVKSRDVSAVLHVLECARLLNRLESDSTGCIVLLSLESAARMYKSFTSWSGLYKVYLTCMRRADVIKHLPERWLIIEGGNSDIGSCLENIIQSMSSQSHPQMKFKVEYSTFAPISNAGVKSQIQRAEKKRVQKESKKTFCKKNTSSEGSRKGTVKSSSSEEIQSSGCSISSKGGGSTSSNRPNFVSAKSKVSRKVDLSEKTVTSDVLPRRPGLKSEISLERSSLPTNHQLGIGRGAIRASLLPISQLNIAN